MTKDIVIITGMSGAGKTSAINICQDNGYYSIDNIPPKLITQYIDYAKKNNIEKEKIAFVIDIRLGRLLEDLENIVEDLRSKNYLVKIIFIDASDNELIRRFQEKRRPHIYVGIPLEEAIYRERNELSKIKKIADEYIDTTNRNIGYLQSKLLEILEVSSIEDIRIMSFGFKYGQLIEADYIFDVRFIKNPFYIKNLRSKTGLDKEVIDYVMGLEYTKEFISKSVDLLEFVIPKFKKVGKNNLVIGVGCSGGQHRSVVISEEINKILKNKYNSRVFHREEKKW